MKELEIAKAIGRELSQEEINSAACKALGCNPRQLGPCRIVKKSVDARGDILYRYKIEAYRSSEVPPKFELAPYQDVHNAEPIVIIGAGPAGMFAALKLLQRGLKPVVLERGKDVHARKVDMATLSTQGLVNPESNYCFGEGGAGTFSDGKLYTRSSKRGDIREVLHQLVLHGASESILVDAHPHIGSDRLPAVVENIRRTIIDHGGEYHFNTCVTDLEKAPDGPIIISCVQASGALSPCYPVTSLPITFRSRKVILATGHSARDIYELFHRKGWALEAKGFALGVRAEHPQSLINRIQYHGRYQPFMPTAEYSFVTNIFDRGVFSFCMCPGGILVPAATAPNELVLNGMSNSARNSKWANAGVVVSIEPGDEPEEFRKDGPLSLLRFQQSVEKAMFSVTDSLRAPAQRMMDFCRGIVSANLPSTSYHPGAISAPLHELLPEHVYKRMRLAFPEVGNKKMHGYYTNDALLLGVESRTSSPVRIPRDAQSLEYISLPGLYPCGEGAGYAGGITSSALDGLLCAEKI